MVAMHALRSCNDVSPWAFLGDHILLCFTNLTNMTMRTTYTHATCQAWPGPKIGVLHCGVQSSRQGRIQPKAERRGCHFPEKYCNMLKFGFSKETVGVQLAL